MCSYSVKRVQLHGTERNSIMAPCIMRESFEPLRRRDSFVAGFLYGYLRNDLQMGMNYGSAIAAYKMTLPNDNFPVIRKGRDRKGNSHRKEARWNKYW